MHKSSDIVDLFLALQLHLPLNCKCVLHSMVLALTACTPACLPPAVRLLLLLLLLLLPAACWGLSCWPTYGCQVGRSCCQQGHQQWLRQLQQQQLTAHKRSSSSLAAASGGPAAAAAATSAATSPTSSGCRHCSLQILYIVALPWPVVTSVAAHCSRIRPYSRLQAKAQGCTAAPAVVWRVTAAPGVPPRTAGAMQGTAGCCSGWGTSSSRKGRPAGTGRH
jgi:hypothetical protein